MKRQIENKLLAWKKQKNHKSLIIKGARQVGKTYIIREFAKNQYHDFLEINFERDIDLFKRTHNPDELLNYLKITNIDTDFNENTLLFLDEIQSCPDALTSLKFMKESFPCDIICSGSMLGIAITKSTSYPVGYVETWDMYPMSFLEFMEALGLKKEILDSLKLSLNNVSKIPDVLHDKMNEYFTTYMIVGGMPEAVNAYVTSHSLKNCFIIQRRIVDDYLNDM